MTIEQATLNDVDRIAPLFDAYRQFYRKPPDLELARAFLGQRLARNESIIFIAVADEARVVGFTQLFPSFSSGAAAPILILNDLYVAPEARRKGTGRGLLRRAATFARDTGAVRLTLSTEVTNVVAQALYEREGWKRADDFRVYTLPL
jgi:GNAT superfamily N-acetyltransferase